MEYVTENKDYSVTEFNETFKNKLPKLVKITHGYDGDMFDDKFCKNRVCHFRLFYLGCRKPFSASLYLKFKSIVFAILMKTHVTVVLFFH